MRTVVDAVNDERSDFGYDPPASRKKLAALTSDARRLVRDPSRARANGAHGSQVRPIAAGTRSRHPVRPGHRRQRGPPIRRWFCPPFSAIVDVRDWDARAIELGGAGYSLLAGFAALLGERLGRARPSDGAVTLLIAMSDRGGEDDRRGNAMKIASATVDPAPVTADLAAARVGGQGSAHHVALRTRRQARAPSDHAVRPEGGRTASSRPHLRRPSGVLLQPRRRPARDDTGRWHRSGDRSVPPPPTRASRRKAVERAGGQLVVAAGPCQGKYLDWHRRLRGRCREHPGSGSRTRSFGRWPTSSSRAPSSSWWQGTRPRLAAASSRSAVRRDALGGRCHLGAGDPGALPVLRSQRGSQRLRQRARRRMREPLSDAHLHPVDLRRPHTGWSAETHKHHRRDLPPARWRRPSPHRRGGRLRGTPGRPWSDSPRANEFDVVVQG